MVTYFVGYITREIDNRYFQISLWPSMDFPFEAYLSYELFRKNIRPLVGNRIMLQYDSDLNEFIIIGVRSK